MYTIYIRVCVRVVCVRCVCASSLSLSLARSPSLLPFFPSSLAPSLSLARSLARPFYLSICLSVYLYFKRCPVRRSNSQAVSLIQRVLMTLAL